MHVTGGVGGGGGMFVLVLEYLVDVDITFSRNC